MRQVALVLKRCLLLKQNNLDVGRERKVLKKEEVLPMIANGSVGSFLSVTPCNCFVFLPMRLDESFFVLLFGIILCFLLAFYFES
mgnify:CR=1 FL=1